MSRILNDIHPKARPQIFELLARATEMQVALMIINVGRTPAEQAALYAIGRTDGQPASKQVTWTLDSKHVMSPKQEGKSLAIDICPWEIYTLQPGNDKLQWNAADPVWMRLGQLGESIGLKWGGRFPVPDLGHFEYKEAL